MKLKTIRPFTLLLLIGSLLAVSPTYSQNEESKRDIVLPDVKIVGRKRFEFVLMGEKTAQVHKFKLPAHRSVGTKEPVGPDLLLDLSPKRVMPQSQWPRGKGLLTFRSEVGSFANLHLGAQAGRERGRTGFALTLGEHAQTAGHVDNSASRYEAIEALVAYNLPDRGDLSLRLGIEDGERELWKAPPRPEERRFRRWETHLAAALPLSRDISTTFGALLGTDEIADRNSSRRAEEIVVRAYGALDARWKGTLVRLAGTYEGVSLDQRTSEGTNHFLGVEASAERVFDSVALRGGIRTAYADDYTTDGEYLVYPMGSLTYTSNARIQMALTFDPSAVPTTLWKMHETNPFLQLDASTPVQEAPSVPIRTRKRPIALTLKLGAQIAEALSGALRVGYEKVEHFPVWTDADTNGTWEVIPNREVTRKVASVRMTYERNPMLVLSSRFTVQQTEFSDTSQGHVPYVPSVTGHIEVGSEPRPGWGLSLSAQIVGPRFVEEGSDEKSDKKLSTYVLLAAQVSKRIASHVHLFLRADNLLDQSYEVWEGYFMPRIGVYGGLKMVW